ncbi:MAG TPA: hypothetical protein PKC80_02640 [Burkholderiaceae bacterium]|nr:hypothetical protein [Burkholderiaceae bacterium]
MDIPKWLLVGMTTGLLFAPNAIAKCASGKPTLFSCSTAKGKTIEVCDAGKMITYTFGSPQAKPEISLNVPRNKVTTFQWNGIGRYLSYAVDIPNDTANSKTTYSVFHGMDRITKEHAVEAGVNVLVDGKLLATVRCSGKNIINNLEGVDLAPTP